MAAVPETIEAGSDPSLAPSGETPYDLCCRELVGLLEARSPLVFLRSSDEARAQACCVEAYQTLLHQSQMGAGSLERWSSSAGFQVWDAAATLRELEWKNPATPPPGIISVQASLEKLREAFKVALHHYDRPYVYLLPDWADLMEGTDRASLARQLK